MLFMHGETVQKKQKIYSEAPGLRPALVTFRIYGEVKANSPEIPVGLYLIPKRYTS